MDIIAIEKRRYMNSKKLKDYVVRRGYVKEGFFNDENRLELMVWYNGNDMRKIPNARELQSQLFHEIAELLRSHGFIVRNHEAGFPSSVWGKRKR